MQLFETTIRLRMTHGRAYPRFLSGGFVKVPVRHDIRPDVVIPVQQGDEMNERVVRAGRGTDARAVIIS